MGTITIVQPDGHEQKWTGRKRRNIAEMMHRFRQRVLTHVRNDPMVLDQYADFNDDNVFGGYIFQMGCYALATPTPNNDDVRLWRNMLILNLMLASASSDPQYPGQLYEYLPDHNINVVVHGVKPDGMVFQPGDMPEGIDMSVQIVPFGSDIIPVDSSHRSVATWS